MFIRSKYAGVPANIDPKVLLTLSIESVNDSFSGGKDDWYIEFTYFNDNSLKWHYRELEDLQEEYKWILEQLNCKVNGEEQKNNKEENRSPFIAHHCGVFPSVNFEGDVKIIKCETCCKHWSSESKKSAIKLWNDDHKTS